MAIEVNKLFLDLQAQEETFSCALNKLIHFVRLIIQVKGQLRGQGAKGGEKPSGSSWRW